SMTAGAVGTGVMLTRVKISRIQRSSSAWRSSPRAKSRTFFTRTLRSYGHGHDPPADQLDAEQPVQHLRDVEGAHARLPDDLLDGVLAVHELEDGQLLAREPAAPHLRDRVLVAQEDQVEVLDLALDEVPLVDAAEALHEDAVDLEPERGVDGKRRQV